MLKRLHGREVRSGSARSLSCFAGEALEPRQFLNAAPVAPGFPSRNGIPGWNPNIEWPRFAEAATYNGHTPTLDITYDQLLALSGATDPDGDTVYFLYGANGTPSGGPYNTSVPHGILGSNGEPLSTPYEWNNLARFDPNSDGIPDGEYVLEPGETWHWVGTPNMAFSGSNYGPPWGGSSDFGPYIVVADTINRPASECPSSYISVSGNRTIKYQQNDSVTLFPNVNLGHTGTLTRTYEEIIAQLQAHGTITDPEGAAPLVVISPGWNISTYGYSTSYATITVGGVNLNDYIAEHHPDVAFPEESELTLDSPYVLGPGESVTFTNFAKFSEFAYYINLWDGMSGMITVANQFVDATANTLPVVNQNVDLGTLDADRTATWTYEQIAAMLSATDADGDAVQIKLWMMLDVGELKVNGQKWTAYATLHPGDSIIYTASGFQAGSNGFTVYLEDGWGSVSSSLAFSAADFPHGNTDAGDTLLAPGARIATATSTWPYGTQVAGWRNAAGELIISVEDVMDTTDDGSGVVTRTTRNLSRELGLPTIIGDPVATGIYGGEMYVATTAGLIAIGFTARHDTQTWSPAANVYLRNLTMYNAGAPETELTLVTPPAGLTGSTYSYASFYGVAGYDHDGDMVIMYESSGMYGGNDSVDVFNVTQAVQDRGMTMPTLASGFAAYAQSWGGYNIVGLDGAGDLIGVWSGGFYLPGTSGYNNIEDSVWEVSNLSQLTGSPRLVGSISVFSTDWNAINIIGTSEAGHAVASWWAPSLGDGNWSFVDFTSQFDGVPLASESLTGWVAPWGALNVAGVDANGQVQVYWWFPTNISESNPEGWVFESLDSPTFASTTMLTSDASTFHAWDTASRYTRMSIFGADADGHVGFTYWEPALGTEWARAWA